MKINMKFLRGLFGFSAATLLSTQASADGMLYCSVNVQDVYLRADGYLITNVQGVSAALCNINSTINAPQPWISPSFQVGVTPEVCKSLQAILMTAKTTGKTVTYGLWTSATACNPRFFTNIAESMADPYPWYFALTD